MAITDPGSPLDRQATEQGFRAVFHGDPNIGGRYSAQSYFGTVPAATMGVDVSRLLAGAEAMARACHVDSSGTGNPGVHLGLVLGLAARGGRDKVTLVTSPGLTGFGAWLEQLLAESTGKGGVGLIPVDGERVGDPAVYGSDRVFVSIRLDGEHDAAREDALDRLASAGHPVVRLTVGDRYDIAGECFRWQFATAVAGAVLGVNPFDQPDVEASKVATRTLTNRSPHGGAVPAETPVARDTYGAGEVTAYVPDAYADELRGNVGDDTLAGWVAAHCGRLGPGDYLAILAFIEMCEPYQRVLDHLRHEVRDAVGVATSVGFGPRFLHSTGQTHKGGPPSGVFLQLTCSDVVDVPVPGGPSTFGAVKAAQARGDFEVLGARKRRPLRLHIDGEIASGLDHVVRLVRDALAR